MGCEEPWLLETIQLPYIWKSITAFTPRPPCLWAAPSQWLRTVVVLKPRYLCSTWDSFNGQYLLGDSPSDWPRLSQNCTAVWGSSNMILSPTLFSWVLDLHCGQKFLYACSCSLSLLFMLCRCFSLVLAHLNLSCICFSESGNWHILINHTQRGASLNTSKITWPESNEDDISIQAEWLQSVSLNDYLVPTFQIENSLGRRGLGCRPRAFSRDMELWWIWEVQ